MKKILIVGGVAGGATAAARLRRLDEGAEIVMFERGGHISFANCGLPYHIGGTIIDREDLILQTPESFGRRYGVDVRIYSEVLKIDRTNKTVSVKNKQTGEIYLESYDKLILSPGAEPAKLPKSIKIEGAALGRMFSLRDLADMDKIMDYIASARPKNAAVVGGGFIGLEMAENLKRAGLDVCIVELSNQLLAPLDIDLACEVQRHLRQKGVSLFLKNGVQEIAEKKGRLNMILSDEQVIETDMVVLALGTRPQGELAREAGLGMGDFGGISTNAHMQTTDPDIYAVGDAVETADFFTKEPVLVPLAGPANKQARIAADNICGIASEYAGTQGSAVVKIFEITAAFTGMNEKRAKRLGLDYDKVFLWVAGHASYYPGGSPMSMKVIFEKGTGKILGAGVVGRVGADKRCDVLATAIGAKMTARELTGLELCYAPPYSSAKDPVNMAGYMIENVLSGKVNNFHWHEVDALARDGSLTLLDVRTPHEIRAGGSLEGFINIPLDELRGHIGELNKTKPVYVHCQSGLRSYIAARILMQHGFETYNLCGGYRLYSSVKSEFPGEFKT